MSRKRKKVCIIIYGIGRGLEITEGPINKLISEIHKYHEVDVNYFINDQRYISNERTGEFGELSKIPTNIFHSAKKYYLKSEIEPYNYVLDELKKHQDSHRDSYKSYHNLILQLRLLDYANKTIDFTKFDYAVCVRDDIFFEETNLNWPKIFRLASSHFFTTSYGWNKGIGDRFFVSNVNITQTCLGRIVGAVEFAKKYDFVTGEQLLYHTLKKARIPVVSFGIKIFRVRFNLELHKERHFLPFWRPSEISRILKSGFRYWLPMR